jgi:hypothetical protein
MGARSRLDLLPVLRSKLLLCLNPSLGVPEACECLSEFEILDEALNKLGKFMYL